MQKTGTKDLHPGYSAIRLFGYSAIRLTLLAFSASLLVVSFTQAETAQPARDKKSPIEKASALVEKRKAPEAIAILEPALRAAPNGPDAPAILLLLGKAYLQSGAKDRARDTFKSIPYRFPKSESAPAALVALSRFYQAENNPIAAKAEMDRLVKDYPDSPTTIKTMLELGDSAFASGDTTRGVSIYEKYEKALSPEQKRRLEAAKLTAGARNDPGKILETARAAAIRGDSALAKQLLETAIRAAVPGSPQALEAKTELAWIQYNTGSKAWSEAESLWKEVLRQAKPSDPSLARARWHLVQLNAGPKDNVKEALSLCDDQIKSNPRGSFRHEQALYTKAWIYWAKRQWTPALAGFQALLQAYPEKSRLPVIQDYMKQCEEEQQKQKAQK